MAGIEGSYVYELVHLDGEWAGLPAVIGVGTTVPPWLRRWELRHWDGSRAGRWFRDLESRGLEPTPSTSWVPRQPLRLPAALKLASRRLAQVRDWAGSQEPEWLLHEVRTSATPRPVTRILDGLEVGRFASVRAAAGAVGVTAGAVWWWLYSGCSDFEGCRWVDACT
jgi:hypothetical protein